MTDAVEIFWDNLLSRSSDRILTEINKLSPGDLDLVTKHLEKMSTEPGWHEEQKISAEYALSIIRHRP